VLAIDPDDPASVQAWTMALPPEAVRRIDRTGGTVLHTSRTNPSKVKPADVPGHVRAQDRVETGDGPHRLHAARPSASSRRSASTPSSRSAATTHSASPAA